MKKLIMLCALAGAFLCNDLIPCYAATTLSDIRTKVRRLLYETDSTNTIYADALLNDFINMAQRMMVDQMPYSAHWNLLKVDTVSVSIGTPYYSLPSGFREILGVRVNQKAAIQVKASDYFGKIGQATIAKDPMFFLMNDYIYIFPTPTAVTQTAEVLFAVNVVDMETDTTEVQTLTEFDNLLSVGAAMLVLTNDNQQTRAAALEKVYTTLLTSTGQTLANSNVIEPVPDTGPQKK